MKHFLLGFVFFFLLYNCYADGPGFSIRRVGAESIFTFKGVSNIKNFVLAYSHYEFYKKDTAKKEFYNQLLEIIAEDPSVIYTQERGRHWEESERDFYISLIDTLHGITLDSMKYVAKDYNIDFTISGVVDGKLQYKADSSKAVFQYVFFQGESTTSVYKKNRIIFIACSILGFLLLLGMFLRKKNNQTN